MEKDKDEYKYLLTIFLYAMKKQDKISINTLFRYIYIYKVSISYLMLTEKQDGEIVINKNLGLGDYQSLQAALSTIIAAGYVEKDDVQVKATYALEELVDNLKSHSPKVNCDLQRISYFSDVVSSYSEDVVLAVFFNEPNIADATLRNRSTIRLSDNKLYQLLTTFESIANSESQKQLGKYDVFVSWLDYVFEQYLSGKKRGDE